MADNTFLGLQPYTEDDAYRFKGRAEESQELYRLIARNDFTVCYAESGEGKTSLLNAGVFPLLRENMYFPIAITFTSDDYQVTPDDFDTIIDRCIKDSITEYNEKNKGVNVEYRFCSSDFQGLDCQAELQQALSKYSWWKLRNYKPQTMGLTFTPVFVFDQFEEVFNMPGSIVWTKKFFDWLEDVASDSCPDEIAKKVRDVIGTNAAFPAIKEEKDFKAVFSLRKEFIGELDYWGMQKCFIPSLKNNRYCLKALTYEGAKKVMTQQERFDESKVEQVLTHFVKQHSREPEQTIKEHLPIIPALMLSIVCDGWEKDIDTFAQLSTAEIGQSLTTVLESFFNQAIDTIVQELSKQLPNTNPSQCRYDLDTSVFALVDGNGKRVRTKTTNAALVQINFDARYKQALSSQRIIKITKVDGEDYVEIVHDCLCPIVARRKEERLAIEGKEREEKKLQEQSQKNRKRLLILLLIILALFIVSGFFYCQKIKIQEQRNIAEKANKKLEENQCSLKEAKDSILGKQRELQNVIVQLQLTKDSLLLSNRLSLLNERKAISNFIDAENSKADAILTNANNLISNGLLIDAATSIEHIINNMDYKYNDEIRNQVFMVLRNLYFAYTYGGQYDKFTAHSGMVCDIGFNSDGSLLATSSNDQTIRIWSSKNGQLIKEYPLGKDVRNVWSNNELNAFLDDYDKRHPILEESYYRTITSISPTMSIWSRRGGTNSFFDRKETPILSPDGVWSLLVKDSNVLVYKGTQLFNAVEVDSVEFIEQVDFAFDNSRFLLFATNGINRFLKEYTIDGKPLRFVDFTQEDYYSTHGCVYLPNTYDILYIEYKKGPLIINEDGEVTSYYGGLGTETIAINPIAKISAFGGKDGSIVLRHYEPTRVYRSADYTDSLFFVREMKNNEYKNKKNLVNLVEIFIEAYIKGKTETVFSPHIPYNVIFDRTRDMMITRASDNTIRFWSLKTKNEIDSLRISVSGGGNIACSPDNRYLVSSSDDMLYVWEIKTGNIVFSMLYKDINYSCFSCNGDKILFTSGLDNEQKNIKVVDFLSDDKLVDWYKRKMPKRKNVKIAFNLSL